MIQRTLRAWFRRDPFPGLAGGLGMARVNDRKLQPAVGDPLSEGLGAVRRAVVSLQGRGAHEDDELRILGIRLPVKLRAAGELPLHELVSHGLAGEVEGPLTDRGMPVSVE